MNLSRADIQWRPKYKIGTIVRIGNVTMKIVSIDYAKCVYILHRPVELTEQFIEDITGDR